MRAEETNKSAEKSTRGLRAGVRKQEPGNHSVQGDGQTEMRNGQGTGEVRDKMESKVSGEREKIFHG